MRTASCAPHDGSVRFHRAIMRLMETKTRSSQQAIDGLQGSFDRRFVRDVVVDVLSLAARAEQLCRAQFRQVLGQRGLGDADRMNQLADRQLVHGHEFMKNKQSPGV